MEGEHMKITPMKDKVLVKPKETEEKTKGGIYIPETAKEKTQEGEVIAVGECKEYSLKVGDKIIYEKYGGTEVKIENTDYILLNAKDVLAIIQ